MTRSDYYCRKAINAMLPYVAGFAFAGLVITAVAWRDRANDARRENKALAEKNRQLLNRLNILEESLDMLSQTNPECATNFVAVRADIVKEYNH